MEYLMNNNKLIFEYKIRTLGNLRLKALHSNTVENIFSPTSSINKHRNLTYYLNNEELKVKYVGKSKWGDIQVNFTNGDSLFHSIRGVKHSSFNQFGLD